MGCTIEGVVVGAHEVWGVVSVRCGSKFAMEGGVNIVLSDGGGVSVEDSCASIDDGRVEVYV